MRISSSLLVICISCIQLSFSLPVRVRVVIFLHESMEESLSEEDEVTYDDQLSQSLIEYYPSIVLQFAFSVITVTSVECRSLRHMML